MLLACNNVLYNVVAAMPLPSMHTEGSHFGYVYKPGFIFIPVLDALNLLEGNQSLNIGQGLLKPGFHLYRKVPGTCLRCL